MIDREAWQQLSALLDEALQREGPDRMKWLAALAQRDPAAAERVHKALGDSAATLPAADDFGRFLAPALGAASAPQESEDLRGARMGAWRLLDKIGQGGMGEVWRAHRDDGLYDAEAAIKLLRSDLPPAHLAARFARERALLARLNHPAIARLLDAGADGGRAYLVLELVAGQTLAVHVRNHVPLLADRVRLLMRVADAVDHAHAQLIVHRDLKPSNVLVTDSGAPKLLDFGIAALMDDEGGPSELTRQAGRGLTPGYAAPEQIVGGPIGTAADVFSLGVMLFELISGALPFSRRDATRTATEHAVLHHEPRRLAEALSQPVDSTASPGRPSDAARARGDLEAIAAKALRKDPAQRYGSVRALNEDLGRWLAHEPVSVRHDDWRHRSHLWLRRHALLASAAALVLFTLAGGLAASTWQWRRAQSAAAQSDAVTRYLSELLASANPDRHGGQVPSVLQLLDTSRAEIGTRFQDDPDTRVRLLEVLGETYHGMNRFDLATPLAEQRIEIARQRYGEDDARTVQARVDLARIYTAQGFATRVVEILEPLTPLIRRHSGLESPDHATQIYQLIVAYGRVGRFDDANRLIAEGRALVAKLMKPDEFEAVFFENYVHSVLGSQGRWAQALAQIEITRPSWATAPKQFARFVLVLRRNHLAARMRLAQQDGIDEQARALVADIDALMGPGNDMAAGLRAERARWAADTGRLDDALRHHDEIARDLRAADVDHPALRLPRSVARLRARALAAADPPALLGQQLRELVAAVDGTAALAGLPRAETQMNLARTALWLGDVPLAAQRLALLRADRSLGLDTNLLLAGRVAQLEGQLARERGDLATSRTLLETHRAHLAALSDVQLLPQWTARLDLAYTLLLQGDAAATAQMLAQADAARPPTLPSHPLDALRQHIQARLDGGDGADAWARLAQGYRRSGVELSRYLGGLL